MLLPAATASRPERLSMSATRVTTVVLPLVPVTARRGAVVQVEASSISLTTGVGAPSEKTGCLAGTPGLTTTSSARRAMASSRSGSGASVSSTPSSTAADRVASVGRSSTTSTSQPRSVSRRATARPVTASPTTTARLMPSSLRGPSVDPPEAEEVGIEDPERQGGAQPGQDPEPHDDGGLGPAQQLEVVVERGHAEHPPVEQAEAHDLYDHRQGDDDEQGPDHRQEQLEVELQGESGQAATDGEGAGVAHEDAGGGGVPPQEPGARTGHGDGRLGQVQRRVHVVDGVVAELPVADEGEGGEGEDRRAGRQAVQTVGQVDGVRRPHQHQHGQHHPPDGPQVKAGRVVAGERQPGAHPRPVQGQPPVAERHHQLGGALGPLVQPQVAAAGDAYPVVEQADGPEGDEDHHDQQAGAGGEGADADVAGQVTGDAGQDDGDPAHDRRARLGDMALGTVLADLLADALAMHPPDEQGGRHQAHHQRHRPGDEDGDHRSASRAARALSWSSMGITTSPICWPVSCPLPATTTVSPGAAPATAMAMAATRSGSTTTSAGPTAPATTCSMIAAGSSWRGLSLVTITRSASLAATSPIRGRLSASRSPPQPNTTMSRPGASALAACSTTARPSGVWA